MWFSQCKLMHKTRDWQQADKRKNEEASSPEELHLDAVDDTLALLANT